ncbi:hypothetical protein ACWEQ7_27405 [Streptomyces sp. NPDC004069]
MDGQCEDSASPIVLLFEHLAFIRTFACSPTTGPDPVAGDVEPVSG